MNIVIYSANIGNYDKFNIPIVYDKNVEYVLFTDNKDFKSKVWNVKNIDIHDLKFNNAKKTRFFKLNPHLNLPNHDISIWVDHCFNTRIKDVAKLIKSMGMGNKNMLCFKHDERNCLYEEAEIVIKKRLDEEGPVRTQIKRYERDGFPKKYGLFQCGFMIRSNNDQVNKFNNSWWEEVCFNSHRDQLSQVYSAWKNNFKIDAITSEKSIYKNTFLEKKNKHIKSK